MLPGHTHRVVRMLMNKLLRTLEHEFALLARSVNEGT
jgi:hypothetical protein